MLQFIAEYLHPIILIALSEAHLVIIKDRFWKCRACVSRKNNLIELTNDLGYWLLSDQLLGCLKLTEIIIFLQLFIA